MRALRLTKEVLAELTGDELSQVHAADASGQTCPAKVCASYLIEGCLSLGGSCITCICYP